MNRDDFPLLERQLQGKDIIYFDSAATSLTPTPVVLAMQAYYEHYTANVHRGSSSLGQMATEAYETGRKIIADFINASTEETIFTRNCSESLNTAAQIICERLSPGDEILCPVSEHHSNFVVWQQLALKYDLLFTVFPITKEGDITIELLQQHISDKTKVVTFAHISNVLGVVQPVKDITHFLKTKDIFVVIDGAQGIVHEPVDMKELQVDAYCFSGHKVLGPTGIGVLYMKKELLEEATPLLYGGEMIAQVSEEESTWNDLPWKFEVGTPPIAEVIGLAAAIIYFQEHNDYNYLHQLTDYTREKLETIQGLTLYGTANPKASVFSFTIDRVHALDIAHMLNAKGIQIREGHLCAQPLRKHFDVESFARISLLGYNTTSEIDNCIVALQEAVSLLRQ
jgi:cysteine desulfurase/selenocysteine lyase